MQGLMQGWPLTVDKIIAFASRWHGGCEVVSRSIEGPIARTTYAQIYERAKRLSNVLAELGIKSGDRVATLAWNTARHMEIWYGAMGIGAVCHTLNPRLFDEQLVYIINHAGDRIIFADSSFAPLLEKLRPKIPDVENIVFLGDGTPEKAPNGSLVYEQLLMNASSVVAWGNFEENTAAGLCYTSGTTGNPKGVLYSHRSTFLHTLALTGVDSFALSAKDVVLAVVPMFHATGWGLPFACPGVGCKLVLPGQRLDGPSLHELLETESVTFSAGVPTVWQMLLTHLRETKGKLTHLKRIATAGSAVPEALVRAYHEEFGVTVIHAWGMTEISPIGTVAAQTAATCKLSSEEQYRASLSQGRTTMMMDAKLTDDEGNRFDHDGVTFGRLMVRGPFVMEQYFGDEPHQERLDSEGYFDTGDVATIDEHGFIRITDRSKDIIKSGGEWISSIEIENLIMGHAKVSLAAVIGVAHEKWAERPLLLVKLRPGMKGAKQEFLDFLEGKIAKWWMPDDVEFVDDLPLGATGKIDKKVIRNMFADYRSRRD